jgi:hypothetical protein
MTIYKSCVFVLQGIYMQKGCSTTSEQMVSKVKCDTDLVEELMQQHHIMASIMQFWLCQYAGPVTHDILWC